MKIKTENLEGAALDWAVAKCEGEETSLHMAHSALRYKPAQFSDEEVYSPSTDWSMAGPIIEREWICVGRDAGDLGWLASIPKNDPSKSSTGATPLIAAMRCQVLSKLGYEVDIPDELVAQQKAWRPGP